MKKANRRISVDLSHEIETDMPQFPAARPYTYLETRFAQVGNLSIGSTLCIFNDHIGTHVDAPLHFNRTGASADRIPLDLLHNTAVILDVSNKKPFETVTVEDVKRLCKMQNVEIEENFIVLFYTSAAKKWGSPEYSRHVVEISPETVRWLYDRGVKVYGVDAISTDIDWINYPTHSLLQEFDHYIIENLTNLDKIKSPIFEFIGYPLKLKGATASPIRAVALVYD